MDTSLSKLVKDYTSFPGYDGALIFVSPNAKEAYAGVYVKREDYIKLLEVIKIVSVDGRNRVITFPLMSREISPNKFISPLEIFADLVPLIGSDNNAYKKDGESISKLDLIYEKFMMFMMSETNRPPSKNAVFNLRN